MKNYGEIKADIESAPKTYLPALIAVAIERAIKDKVFVPGGATHLAKRIEGASWEICPFCGQGRHLIHGEFIHVCSVGIPLYSQTNATHEACEKGGVA